MHVSTLKDLSPCSHILPNVGQQLRAYALVGYAIRNRSVESPFFGQDDYWRSVADALLHAFPGLSTRRSTGLGISHQTRHIANVTDNHSGLGLAFFWRLLGCTLCGFGVL